MRRAGWASKSPILAPIPIQSSLSSTVKVPNPPGESANRPRSIYRYSNMAPGFQGTYFSRILSLDALGETNLSNKVRLSSDTRPWLANIRDKNYNSTKCRLCIQVSFGDFVERQKKLQLKINKFYPKVAYLQGLKTHVKPLGVSTRAQPASYDWLFYIFPGFLKPRVI